MHACMILVKKRFTLKKIFLTSDLLIEVHCQERSKNSFSGTSKRGHNRVKPIDADRKRIEGGRRLISDLQIMKASCDLEIFL